MPKRAFNLTIIVENSEDSPVPHYGDLASLLMNRNYEVVELIAEDGGSTMPIVTIRETAKQ